MGNNRNSIAGSAVCSFTLDSMQESFAGPFRAQVGGPNSQWESVHSTHSHSHCTATHHQHSSSSAAHQATTSANHPGSLLEAEKYQLMERAVQPAQKAGPLIRLDLERFTHVAVDVVTTKIHSSVHVVYVATKDDGLIRKYSVLPRTQEACLVEIIDPFQPGTVDRRIKTMQFLKQQVRAVQRCQGMPNFFYEPIYRS